MVFSSLFSSIFLITSAVLLLLFATRSGRLTRMLNTSSPARSLIFGLGLLVLATLWYGMFIFMQLWLLGALSPWEMWGNLAPAHGTWQRALNDTFEQEWLRAACAAFIVAVSIALFGAAVQRNHARPTHWPWLPIVFAITTLAFIVALVFSIPLSQIILNLWLPQPRPSIDIGYHRTWLSILLGCLLLAALYFAQWRWLHRADAHFSAGEAHRSE